MQVYAPRSYFSSGFEQTSVSIDSLTQLLRMSINQVPRRSLCGCQWEQLQLHSLKRRSGHRSLSHSAVAKGAKNSVSDSSISGKDKLPHYDYMDHTRGRVAHTDSGPIYAIMVEEPRTCFSSKTICQQPDLDRKFGFR